MTTVVTIAEPQTSVTVEEQEITVSVTETTTEVSVASGVTDHGGLTGLADDDHTQYLLKAGGTMTGDLVLAGDPDAALEAATKQYVDAAGASVVIDTKANILALSPEEGDIAYATDTDRFMVYDGSTWQEATVLYKPVSAPDMGYEQNSSKTGYGEDYVTDKRLANVVLGGNEREENGGIRIDVANDPDTFEIYLRNAWQTIIYDLTTEFGDFRHTPLAEAIYVWSGNSEAVGLNGRPVVQEYEVSMGALPPARTLNGGTF